MGYISGWSGVDAFLSPYACGDSFAKALVCTNPCTQSYVTTVRAHVNVILERSEESGVGPTHGMKPCRATKSPNLPRPFVATQGDMAWVQGDMAWVQGDLGVGAG